MTTRELLEKRERENLAPYACLSGKHRGRVCPEPEHPYRTAFQRDRDRIIYCSAFRRLQYKTQVFVNHEGDHYRTRLSHSIEVAQVARTIARALRLNEELAEAAALAHDLGHGPFGHAGEETLRELMKNHGGFEHNGQSLRIVDKLERRYDRFSGLNLTYELRECIIKHTTLYDAPSTPADFNPQERPVLEGQVVDMADPIAYTNHDVEDAVAAGIITLKDLEGIRIWAKAAEAVRREYPEIDPKLLVRHAVRHMMNLMITDLIDNTTRLLTEHKIGSLADVRNAKTPLVMLPTELGKEKAELDRFLYQNVYCSYRVTRMQKKAGRFIEAVFCEYVKHPEQMPPEHQECVRAEGVHRAVCDYVAGMTDRYIQEEYQKLFAPFERV